MQSLKLESFAVEVRGEKVPLFYKKLVRECVEHIPQGGVILDEQRKRIRILEALSTAEDTLDLEDADAETLKRLVNEMTWGIVDKGIVKFCDDVAGMKAGKSAETSPAVAPEVADKTA